MQKCKINLAAALAATVLAATCGAQSAADLVTPQVTRVADKLQCPCGCNLTMACFMPPSGQCGTCRIAKEKIIALQAQGKSDQAILDQFVTENGKGALAITPGVVGFAGPYVALALGLGIVALVIRRYRRPETAAVAAPPLDPETIERIEKDLAKLD